MRTISKAVYEEIVFQAGMEVCGGSLSLLPHADPTHVDSTSSAGAGNVAWSDRGIGLFAIDAPNLETLDMESIATRDVISCTVILGGDGVVTDFAIGDHGFGADGTEMTLSFVPRGERFRFVSRTRGGLKAVTILVDLIAIMNRYGLSTAALPDSLQRAIRSGEIVTDRLSPGRFGLVASDIVARHGIYPAAAPLYYQSKALELISTLLGQISHQDAIRTKNGLFDRQALSRVEMVRKTIDADPCRALDVDALARAAAMNRTKLRAAFKQAYGTTLSDYRAALLLQQADHALRQSASTVEQAAYRAGYASASSFIVAYKRRYGVSPGEVLHRRLDRHAPLTAPQSE